MVLREVFGHDLPSYGELYATAGHQPSVTYTVTTGLEQCFDRVDRAVAGDMVILNIGGRPWHCGIMVSDDRFLHWPVPSKDKPGLLSCIERLDSPTWARRFGGFYRVRAA